jgi:hypothetical protein
VSTRATLATRTASASLLAIGALHALWATGSSWPLGDEHALADTVAGRPGGRTDLLSPGATSARFRAKDRRLYSPLCLALAALSVPAARGRA